MHQSSICKIKDYYAKAILVVSFSLSLCNSSGQTTIFSESFGSPGSNTSVNTYAGYQQYGVLTFTAGSSGADVRTSNASSGYGSASGSGNVLLNSASKFFEISNINTNSCSSLSLALGVRKGANATTQPVIVQVSSDGSSYTTLTYANLTTGTGSVGWYYITLSGTIPSTTNLRIKVTGNDGGNDVRVDDVILSGNCSSCTAPTATLGTTSQTLCTNTATSFSVGTDAGAAATYTWQASTSGAVGTWTNVVNGTPTGASYSGLNSATLSYTTGTGGLNYYYHCLVTNTTAACTASSNTNSVTINQAPSITSSSSSQTISTGSSATFTVLASSSSPTYQWQQNTGSGYVNISAAGSNPTFSGYTTASLSISNPTIVSSYSYQCVISNSCGTVTTTPKVLTCIIQGTICPYIKAVLINGCTGSCGGEGNNEFVVMNSGSYSIAATPANIKIVYSGGSPALQNFTGSFSAQPSIINNLNSLAGCGSLFVDVSAGGTIPAESTFFVMNQGSCFDSGSFADYCGLGTIYVVFSTDADWNAAGYFGNNTTSRYFQTDFSGVNAGCGVTTYSYNTDNSFDFGNPSGSAGDGASVAFSGTTASYISGEGNCVPSVTILPIELLDFYATINGDKNDLIWKVDVEDNILGYTIEKSDNGVDFREMTIQKPYNNINSSVRVYVAEDYYPNDGITYYRLSTLEVNGVVKYFPIISVDRNSNDSKSLSYQENKSLVIEFKNNVPENTTVQLFDISGNLLVEKLVVSSQTKISTNYISDGLYFVKITNPYKTQNFKIVISN
jgi:hypothetical protein